MDINYNPFSLQGKTILVTGASSGIGRAIACECSKMGAKVVITARDKKRLDETLHAMDGDGHQVIVADLTIEDAVLQLVSQLPQLNGVVYNAGIGSRALAKNIKSDDIAQVIQTNFIAPILLQRHLMKKKLLAKESSIVFIASRAPFAPVIGNALYSASKAAIIGFANVFGVEVAPQQIRVNCICPAMVMTELAYSAAMITGVDLKKEELKYPLKRYGKPEDIAYLSIYLLSNASSWMTGTCVDITGGCRTL